MTHDQAAMTNVQAGELQSLFLNRQVRQDRQEKRRIGNKIACFWRSWRPWRFFDLAVRLNVQEESLLFFALGQKAWVKSGIHGE